MQRKPSNPSIADKIAEVLSTTPANFDIEDDAIDETNAKVLTNINSEETDEVEDKSLSKLRRQNVDLLSDVDARYAGKKSSRKNLVNSDSSDSEIYDDPQNDSEQSTGDEEEESEQSDSDNSTEEDRSDYEEGNSFENDEIENSGHDDNFKHIHNTDVPGQIKKGLCVRNQMHIWENLLELRIQLQKCLATANKMPQEEVFKDIKKQSGPEFTNKLAETRKNVGVLMDKFLQFQKLVTKKYPETKNLDKEQLASTSQNNDSDENEEIPSDAEGEKSENEEEEMDNEMQPQKKIRKLNDYEHEISNQFEMYKNYRNSVIQKWNDKTRLGVIKHGTANHSILDQIKHHLGDKAKLIKRTQTKRTQYAILGHDAANNVDESLEEYNTEIFDDDDFYHQLLRELVEMKSADLTDPVQLGRQWIQLQNLRSKMKRKIDTKATKGRKIRYVVHTKLVNFMAPYDTHLWTDEAKTELYNSLFKEA